MVLPQLTGLRRFMAGRGFKFDAGPNSQTTSEGGRSVGLWGRDIATHIVTCQASLGPLMDTPKDAAKAISAGFMAGRARGDRETIV